MPVRVTLPVLVTTNVYGTCCPAPVMLAVVEPFATDRAAPWETGTVAPDGFEVTGLPPGSVPAAEATSVTLPLSRSAWATT